MHKKIKAIFLDRDGTINVDKEYLYKIDDFEFEELAIEGLKKLSELGYLLIIITNQSGLARGYYTESDLKKLHRWMLRELARNKIKIKKIYYCPHLPEAKLKKYSLHCECRKPGTLLFYKAIKKYKIDLDISYAIGDKLRDLKLCSEKPIRGFLLSKNDEKTSCTNIRICTNLYEAACIIEAENNASGL